MGTTINYSSEELRTIDAVSSVRIYDATTGKYTEKAVTRFTDSLYGTGTAQDIQLHAYKYTANGKVQTVSMSQLFMTVCMNRANDIEEETVKLMAKMSDNTTKLTELADLEDIALNGTTITTYNAVNYFDIPAGGHYSVLFSEVQEDIHCSLPSFIPTGTSTTQELTAEQYEQYKAWLSDVIEEYRKLMNSNPYYFHNTNFCQCQLPSMYYVNWRLEPELIFSDLFGDSKSDFTTCYWYQRCFNLQDDIGVLKKYKVGDKIFNSLDEVKAYALSAYGIDMNKSQSEVTQALESKMDEYNSISQEDMIELQSKVNKRDQSYTLISNALKSMYNSNLSAANNLK